MRAVALGALALGACGEREYTIQTLPPPSGELIVSGRACDPTTMTWIDGALVYTHLYDNNDVVWDSRSDHTGPDGAWALTDLAPRLDYEVYVQVGQQIVDTFVVELGDEDFAVPAPPCTSPADRDVAVISDDASALAPWLEAIGAADAEVIDGQGDAAVTFLSDAGAMHDFELIVLDGGIAEDGLFHGVGPVDRVLDGLRMWVRGGGVLLVTDWAYDAVERGWPERVDFFGDDAVPDAAQVGDTSTVRGRVVDGPLALATGLDEVDIDYDLPAWPLVDGVGPDVRVYVTGDAPWRRGLQAGTAADVPLLLGFEDGEGRVLLATWRPAANVAPALVGLSAALLEGP